MTQDPTAAEPDQTSQDQVVELVGAGREVLLVGCADGDVARDVVGVDVLAERPEDRHVTGSQTKLAWLPNPAKRDRS